VVHATLEIQLTELLAAVMLVAVIANAVQVGICRRFALTTVIQREAATSCRTA